MRIAPKPNIQLVTLKDIVEGSETSKQLIRAPVETEFPAEKFFIIERESYFSVGRVDYSYREQGYKENKHCAFDIGKELLCDKAKTPGPDYQPGEFRPSNAAELLAILSTVFSNRTSALYHQTIASFKENIQAMWREAMFISALTEIAVKPDENSYFISQWDTPEIWHTKESIPQSPQFYNHQQEEPEFLGFFALEHNSDRTSLIQNLFNSSNKERALSTLTWITGTKPSLRTWKQDKAPDKPFRPLFGMDRIICDPTQVHTHYYFQVRRYNIGRCKQ